ncbi:ribosomal protein S5 domain 2-type protein [Kalaharituber pfeilii]|nr:ribosomal protein S5 domain 2-type protein [Kalaharituber pfeilii]
MPREPEPSINERAFVLEALRQGLRIDGRGLDEFRKVDISFGDEYGVADVKLGKTRVITRVSAEVTKPYPDRPYDGIFSITTELGPMATPAFEVGRSTEQEVLLARLIEKAIRRSHAIDTESLCIVAGQKCWNVRADVHFLDHDGALVDASCIAVIAALAHFRRPDVSVEGESVTIHTLAERVPVPLSILHYPICVTFSFFHGGDTVLMDATLQEEQLREGDMTITLNRHADVCQISKAGGTPIEAMVLMSSANKALVVVQETTELLKTRLEEDQAQRAKRDNLLESTAENDRRIKSELI